MRRVAFMACMAIILGVHLFPGAVMAFSEKDLHRVSHTGHCPDCDLSGAKLNWAILFEANLSGAYEHPSILTPEK